MSEESAFRGAVAAIFLLSFGTALFYRLRAACSRERLARREEGWILLISIRSAGLVLLVSALLYLFAPHWLTWAQVPLAPAARWCGAPLGAASAVLLAWTLKSLGSNLTDTVVTRERHSLVTSGPYRWIRHPFYVAMLLLVIATSLLAANWLIAITGAFVFVLLAIRTPIEEAKLEQRFGDVYREYMAHTPRYVPRLRSLQRNR